MRCVTLFVTACLLAGGVRGSSVEDFYPLRNGDYRNYQEEGGSGTVTEQVSSSSSYGAQFRIFTSLSDYDQDMYSFVGYSGGDLYIYGAERSLVFNQYIPEYGLTLYSIDVKMEYSTPVKILEGDYLSGSGGTFSSSFSGTAYITIRTSAGDESDTVSLSGTVSGSVEPFGTVEAMSGVFLNCQVLSYDMSVVIDPTGNAMEMSFPNTSYLAPGVGPVRSKVYEVDQYGNKTYQYDTVLISGRANGQTISPAILYNLTVNNGYADETSCVNGQQVSIHADSPPIGQVFDRWVVSPSQYASNLGNAYASSTTFTMPAAAVTLTATYKAQNRAPLTPTPVSPANAAQGRSLTLTLQGSAFSDPDGDSNVNSQWQVDDSNSFSSPEWDSGETWAAGIQTTVPVGRLTYSTRYYWRMRYKDSRGSWSEWSYSRTFTTESLIRVTDPESGGSITPSGDVAAGSTRSVTLTAVPNSGYKVKHWLVDGEITAAGQKELTIENITVDMTVEAVFEKIKAMPWLNLLLE
jgi:hypothetical protein